MSNLNLMLPKIEREATARNYGKFIISPLERGFGTTIGNALRRVLLAALPGAAITSVRVMDVPHEFSPIPHVKEDMTQLILNLKKVRLRFLSENEDTARMELEARGEGVVTAADISCPAWVEIVNPEQYLFTVDDPDGVVEMEFTARPGRGYLPADRHGKLPIGEIPVDAIFSPIRKVNFDVDQARVGQRSDYDKLILEIWTDGTISPEEAMSESASILMRYLSIIAGVTEESLEPQPQEEIEEEPGKVAPEVYDTPIEQLDLSVRVFNSLKRTGITTVGEVLEMLERGPDAMLAIRNFGEKSLNELLAQLKEKGFLTDEMLASYMGE